MLVFKSDSHRLMFHNMLKMQIKSNILNRFGGMGQEECRIMRSKSFKEFLTLWSNSILNHLPKDSNSQSDFIKSQMNFISDEILNLPSVKSLMDQDSSLKWMIGRINSKNDNVPKPYFPSLLRNTMIQFPFKHTDIQKSKDLYGLLKFPFYKLSTSLYGDSAEGFKGLVEPSDSHTTDDLNDDNKYKTDTQPTSYLTRPSHLLSSTNTDDTKYCSTNYIYSPSELETGLRDT